MSPWSLRTTDRAHCSVVKEFMTFEVERLHWQLENCIASTLSWIL
jgi:hypothetical protein